MRNPYEGMSADILSLVRKELDAEIEVLQDEIVSVNAAKVKANMDGAVHKTGKKHYCDIHVKSCWTSRECFCLNSDGQSHSEDEYPLIGVDGKKY